MDNSHLGGVPIQAPHFNLISTSKTLPLKYSYILGLQQMDDMMGGVGREQKTQFDR